MKKTYSFPTFSQMYANEARIVKKVKEYIRYQFRTILCNKERQQFVHYLQHNTRWQPLFNHEPYRVNTLLEKYCNRSFNKSERLEAILTNFMLMEKLLPLALCRALSEGKSIEMAKLTDNLKICLMANQLDPLEGFWAITLRDHQDMMIYHASFSFIKPNGLLIASIQGTNQEDAQAMIKKVTKELHGVRPMFMLITVFKLLSQQLNVELFGIAHKDQVKYRWNDHSRLLFNYDQFWQENNAQCNGIYWQIPRELTLKPLAEIASNKRSMYRKRYMMFEQLATSLTQLVQN
ncbi:VirK/YbjX family protein [[Haemophilus] ducreyi]|uniref:VirK/YbjX family protein n=1 Tax=Haemophilus ducreyi TaxID=730 RepID=UPI0006550CB9|nr:DUF535 family protein [[Haemophilus] ducreyi]AKO45475.1 hypothetical protein RZ66_04305 [[Haemophilus] ducreyi]AKO46862.1 hypothetical protein RZ67_04200 [[Haemophilus] ducreyi]AKO48201.1 hypothetical protein RZ68_04185 [[Haemophilus] ducreyi]AKO49592.1 hypothetical protein RZ69_04235 [[Haemophilus] ducreyi]ANF62504.1 hypothetical protein A6037_07230 [[Haemophilus] ducreyi]